MTKVALCTFPHQVPVHAHLWQPGVAQPWGAQEDLHPPEEPVPGPEASGCTGTVSLPQGLQSLQALLTQA